MKKIKEFLNKLKKFHLLELENLILLRQYNSNLLTGLMQSMPKFQLPLRRNLQVDSIIHMEIRD